jgi:hypothetical protein
MPKRRAIPAQRRQRRRLDAAAVCTPRTSAAMGRWVEAKARQTAERRVGETILPLRPH